jgi:hypothetical protein
VSIAGVEWEEEHMATFKAPKEYVSCCSGPCCGGTKLCPSPEACQKAIDEKARASVEDFCGFKDKVYLRIGLFIIAASCVAVVAGAVQLIKWWTA